MNKMFASAAVIAAFGLAAPAMAQQSQQDTQPKPEQEQTAQKDPGTEVTVDQGSPDVTVEQPAPTVTVVDPEPQVQVDTPEPQVSVDQPEPEVQVDEGQPNVQVQQQGQPEVIMKEKSTATEMQQGQQEQQTQQATISQQELETLVGKNVYDSQGEEAGEIAEVLPAEGDGTARIVIERGGVLGIGEKRHVVSADQLQMNGEQAQLPMTKDQIAELPTYEGEQAQ